ncbi:MAG: hypothetical protein JSS27_01000 [Planctomycetes bacterium]|nr:hypothetical protein [Planctomycetota bacterium]
MSLKDNLFSALGKPELIAVRFMGNDCFIRPWSERDKIDWAMFCKQQEESQTSDLLIRCRVIAWSLCDEAGNLLFDRATGADELAKFPSNEIDDLFKAVVDVQQSSSEQPVKN